MSNIYSLSEQVDLNRLAVKSEFMERVATYAKQLGYSGSSLTCNVKPLPLNLGGMQIDGHGVVDICQLKTFYQMNGITTLGMEIAYMRYNMLPFFTPDWSFTVGNMPYALVYDYFLSSSLCLVEIFDSGSGRVTKFFATRNVNLATTLIGDEWGNKVPAFEKGIEMNQTNYELGAFRLLKVAMGKNDNFKISVPRNSVDLSGLVKVTPLYFILEGLEGFQSVLDNNMLQIKYIKDNLTVREIVTTTNNETITKYYGAEHALKVFNARTIDLSRGYIRVPELGLSKYDATGVRALNLSRIVEIKAVGEFDASYIEVDFDNIMPKMREGVNALSDTNRLKQLYFDIVGSNPPDSDFYTLRIMLINHIEMQHKVGSTMALKAFHKFMLQRPDVFKGYTGLKAPMIEINTEFRLGFKKS